MTSHDKSTYSWSIPKFPSRGHGLAFTLEDFLEPLREFRRLEDTRGDGGSGDGGDGGELGMMGTSASSCGPEVERSRVTGNSCHAIIYTSNDIRYPLVNVYKKLWKDPPCYSWVNQRFQWQFSIAMCCCHDLIINFPRFTKFMALSEKMRTPKWRAFSAFSWIFTTKDQKWGWVKTLYPWWTSK